MKTYSIKGSEIKRAWHVIDASDKILGKVATEAAKLLMGKHKPLFTRNLDIGDFVVIINAGKIKLSGDKAGQKVYYRHSQYPGGLKSVNFEKLMQTHPTRAVEYAVKGMLPHNRMGASMIKKLKVYEGDTHPHLAQTETAVAVEKDKENDI
jgi:large subunit ribosomal protein L13